MATCLSWTRTSFVKVTIHLIHDTHLFLSIASTRLAGQGHITIAGQLQDLLQQSSQASKFFNYGHVR